MSTVLLEKNEVKENDAIQQKVQGLITSGRFTQTQIAKQIDYSSAALSTFLKGDYKGNVEQIKDALKKFLDSLKVNEKRLKTVLKYAETSVAKNLWNIAGMCQYNGEIGVCFGSSGLGKTTAIKEYAKEKLGVIIVDPDEKTSPRAILKQIATQLGIPTFPQLMEQFIEDVTKRLYGTNKIIIVDEAENLDTSSFRLLRKLHDRCDNTCSILFVGTEVLYGNLLKLNGEYNYIVNRIAACKKLDNLTRNDIKMLVTQIFPNSTEELLQEFEIASNKNARVLYNTLKRAKDICTASGEELNKDIIKNARGFLLVANERV